MLDRARSSFISIAVLIAIWAILAAALQSRYLPAPLEVFQDLWTELLSGRLTYHLTATLFRVTAAFVLAMMIGTAIGIALGRSADVNRFFDLWLILALNIPALVVIVFCYLWIGLTETAAIVAVALNKIPSTAVTLREGARALDPQLDDVANIFEYTGWRRFKLFTWPQLEPYFAAAVRSGLALIWKVVLVVELIGRSSGVGFQINLFFSQFDLARILVYALSFMVIIMVIEALIIKPWEKRARGWRGEAS